MFSFLWEVDVKDKEVWNSQVELVWKVDMERKCSLGLMGRVDSDGPVDRDCFVQQTPYTRAHPTRG